MHVLSLFMNNYYLKAFLAEPGYNAQARTIPIRYNESGPTLNIFVMKLLGILPRSIINFLFSIETKTIKN